MHRKVLFLLLAAALLLTACGPGLPFGLGPSETPTPTETVEPTMTFTPAPTDTPVPSPTEAPAQLAPPSTSQPMGTPAQASVPPPVQPMIPVQGEPLLMEQFADNARGWAALYPDTEAIVQNGNLYVKGSQTDQKVGAYCSGLCGPYQISYYYQAQLVEEVSSDQGFGLIFGLDPGQDNYYNFMIRPYQRDFSLLKRANGNWTALLNWTDSTAIQAFPQPNTLGVSFQMGSIELYVNGTKVGNYVDPNPYNAGRVGFYIDKDNLGLLVRDVAVFFQEPPLASATPIPKPTLAVTPTFTPQGACPPDVPNNTWALVIFNPQPKRERITINGERQVLQTGPNVFYLRLKQTHTIEIGGKIYYHSYNKCQVVYLKLK